jgi:hypothetical protein
MVYTPQSTPSRSESQDQYEILHNIILLCYALLYPKLLQEFKRVLFNREFTKLRKLNQ